MGSIFHYFCYYNGSIEYSDVGPYYVGGEHRHVMVQNNFTLEGLTNEIIQTFNINRRGFQIQLFHRYAPDGTQFQLWSLYQDKDVINLANLSQYLKLALTIFVLTLIIGDVNQIQYQEDPVVDYDPNRDDVAVEEEEDKRNFQMVTGLSSSGNDLSYEFDEESTGYEENDSDTNEESESDDEQSSEDYSNAAEVGRLQQPTSHRGMWTSIQQASSSNYGGNIPFYKLGHVADYVVDE